MKRILNAWLFFLLTTGTLFSQNFIVNTDTLNPINTVSFAGSYRGCAWVDFDNDGDLDLSMLGWAFRNMGADSFEIVQSFGGGPLEQNHLLGGVSWNDFDNDGDKDCLYAYTVSESGAFSGGTFMYVNENGEFTLQAIDDNESTRTWSATVGDYNNDGNMDVVGAVAFNFAGLTTAGFFYEGKSDGTFSRVDTFEFAQNTAPYTVAYWIDYDLDGDTDLFIASGPAGTAAPDYIYRNMWVETGTPGLERIDDIPFATDPQDGQCYNVTDYDLDGDLDMYVTNYNGAPNRFYENQNGTFSSISNNLTFNGPMLGNCWGDFDNDGDEDVLITGDNIPAAGYYENQSGTFVKTSNPFDPTFIGANISGLTIGDYDEDGDLDFFANGGAGRRALYKNDLSNANHWVQFDLTGVMPSNRAALGTTIALKTTINGSEIWLQRQVSAQNTFMGHNAQRIHFGLGENTQIDSVRIHWPSGVMQTLSNLEVDSIYQITESDIANGLENIFQPAISNVVEVFPNPGKSVFNIRLKGIENPKKGMLDIFDLAGKQVFTQVTDSSSVQVNLEKLPKGVYSLLWELESGSKYSGRLVKQ